MSQRYTVRRSFAAAARRRALSRCPATALIVRKPSTARSRKGRKLSEYEGTLRARAFGSGVDIGEMFFITRRALLRQYAPGQPPLVAVRRFPALFVDMTDDAVRGFAHHHRDLLTSEIVAGLMCELLTESQWRHDGV